MVIVMDNKKWMVSIDDNADVFRLNMIGTHDCVTQYIRFGHFFRCQNRNIFEQLCLGVRGLDIRVEMNKNRRLGMVHAIFKAFSEPGLFKKQMDMADVLAHCYRFLAENPSETIVFQFKNESAKHMEECFDIMYNTYINPDADKWYLGKSVPKLGEVRGKIIFIRRCKKYEDKEYPLGTGIDFSRWVEQTQAIPQPLMLSTGGDDAAQFIVQDRYKYKPEPRWNVCIKPFLDTCTEFGGKYIINYLSTAGGLKGPYNNAEYINPRFMQYPLCDNVYYGMIYTDFPTKELADKIIKTNFRSKI